MKKIISKTKKFQKKSLYYKSDQFLAVHLILGDIFNSKTQKQRKKKRFLIRYGQSEQNILSKIKCQAKHVFLSDVSVSSVSCFPYSYCLLSKSFSQCLQIIRWTTLCDNVSLGICEQRRP